MCATIPGPAAIGGKHHDDMTKYANISMGSIQGQNIEVVLQTLTPQQLVLGSCFQELFHNNPNYMSVICTMNTTITNGIITIRLIPSTAIYWVFCFMHWTLKCMGKITGVVTSVLRQWSFVTLLILGTLLLPVRQSVQPSQIKIFLAI